MAFQTTQGYDNVLLRNLTFRTTGNAAISSQYALFANGVGQTYWSNAVLPVDLSTVSTSYGIPVSTLSTSIDAVYNGVSSNLSSFLPALAIQSSHLRSTNLALFSSVSSLIRTDRTLSTSLGQLSNNFNTQSNRFVANIAGNYVSSINYINSSLFGISSISTFFRDIAAVQASLNSGLSSISTTLGVQSRSTCTSLTSNYTAAFSASSFSTTLYLQQQISTVSTAVAFQKNLSTFSSIITRQLLSTSAGFQLIATQRTSTIRSNVSTVYNTIIVPLNSTVYDLAQNVANLGVFSTYLYSTTYLWISTFTSTSQSFQDRRVYSTIATTDNNLAYLTGSTTNLMSVFSSFSSTTVSTISSYNAINALFSSTIMGLSHEYSVIKTSSVLASIYDSFMALAGSTSSLVGSTIATGPSFQSSVYYSTGLQNTSIGKAYFMFDVSTLYASTLSTLIQSSILYVSTAVSTLYSTGSVFLLSSLTSSATGISNGFLSTISSLTQEVVLSSPTQIQSSLVGYLSTPFSQVLSTFSTNQYAAISSYGGAALAQTSTQSASLSGSQSTFLSLYTSSVMVLSSLSTQFVATSLLLSSFATQNQQQNSTQTGQLVSSLNAYPTFLVSSLNSTNATVYAVTTVAANSTLVGIENSTTVAFNAFTATVNSTTSVSTLYTAQTLALTGSTTQVVLDFVTYRNFTINIYGLDDAASNYSIVYLSNNLQGSDYFAGVITVDVSTVGAFYSTALRMDTYRWGLPTTVFGNLYPLMSNANYMLQYDYTILNQVVYTTLLNVYPRLRTQAPSISTIARNVYDSGLGAYSPTIVWRGSPVLATWTNYSFFPIGLLGAPPFDPTVQVDVLQEGALISSYGPYPMTVSSALITAPFAVSALAPPLVSTTVLTYVTGGYAQAVSTAFVTAQPAFTAIQMFSPAYPASQGSLGGFLGGTELVAITRSGAYPLYANPTVFVSTQTSAVSSFNGDPTYRATNLVGGTLNAVGAAGSVATAIAVGPSNVVGNFTEVSAGAPGFYVNLNAYFTTMSTLQTFGASFTFTFSNAFAGAYSFPAPLISSIGGSPSLYLLSNSGIVKASPTFTSGPCALTYSYTAVPAISTTTGYTPSSFIGPISAGTPDNAVFFAMSSIALAAGDTFSTLTFYNLPPSGPVGPAATRGTQIVASLINNGVVYSSTFTTTTALGAQIVLF